MGDYKLVFVMFSSILFADGVFGSSSLVDADYSSIGFLVFGLMILAIGVKFYKMLSSRTDDNKIIKKEDFSFGDGEFAEARYIADEVNRKNNITEDGMRADAMKLIEEYKKTGKLK